MVHPAENRCTNGGCTRQIYRARMCFRCWAGVKWTSLRQRVENRTGRNKSYEGVRISFTKDEFIQWILDNPPPSDMEMPSIDRIENEKGYAFDNIRWLEHRFNSAGPNKDLAPIGKRRCSVCGEILPADNKHFPRTVKRGKMTLSTMCKPCNNDYQKRWKDGRAS